MAGTWSFALAGRSMLASEAFRVACQGAVIMTFTFSALLALVLTPLFAVIVPGAGRLETHP